MNKIGLSHPEAHEKLTARLFWRLSGQSGYNDAGNVKDYVDATTRSLVTRARAEDGIRHVDDEQADMNHEAYTFLLDERVAEQEKLLKLAKVHDNLDQDQGEGITATLESVQLDRWYPIGAYNIANLTASASVSGALAEGEDYEVDLENGRIYIRSGAGTSAGEDVSLVFDQPAMSFEYYVTQKAGVFYCDFILEEHNQFSELWLRRLTGKCFLNVTEFPSQTGEFGTYRLKLTPAGPVTVRKRSEAASLAQAAATEEGPAHSSSSSSESSASSSESSSSQSSSSSSVSSSGIASGPQP